MGMLCNLLLRDSGYRRQIMRQAGAGQGELWSLIMLWLLENCTTRMLIISWAPTR